MQVVTGQFGFVDVYRGECKYFKPLTCSDTTTTLASNYRIAKCAAMEAFCK